MQYALRSTIHTLRLRLNRPDKTIPGFNEELAVDLVPRRRGVYRPRIAAGSKAIDLLAHWSDFEIVVPVPIFGRQSYVQLDADKVLQKKTTSLFFPPIFAYNTFMYIVTNLPA